MANDDGELRGVGGWLGFFVVVIAIFSPLRILITTYTSLHADPEVALAYGSLWDRLVFVEWIISGSAVLLCWFIAWRLVAHHVWTSVRIAIAGIWMVAVGYRAVEFGLVSLLTGIPIDALMALSVFELIQPLFFGLLWTAYLLRSERVANTYPPASDAAEVAGVFD